MKKWLVGGGAVLLLASAPVLLLQASEEYLSHKAYSRYRVNPLTDAKVARFDGNQVEIIASSLNQEAMGTLSQLPPMAIKINGRDYSARLPADIPPGFTEAPQRYHSLALVTLHDRLRGVESLVTVEGWGSLPSKSWEYRLLFVTATEVREERFGYRERGSPLYRVPLIRFIGSSLGFKSDLLQLWPTLWYPMVYPWLTALVGALVIIVGAAWRRGASIKPAA